MLDWLSAYFRHDLALDLGTWCARIAVPGEGVVVDEPSLVAVAPRSRRVLSEGAAVGRLAAEMQGRTPDSIAVIRPMVGGAVADFQLCEALLRRLFSKAGRRLYAPRVLAAVPGSLTAVERRALESSIRRAGARGVMLVHAAKAAALGAGLPLAEPLASMVCDIGGGTTEIAVLSLGGVVAGTSIPVAGEAMDRALAAWLRRHLQLRVSLTGAERLRIELGSAAGDDDRAAEVRGLDAASGLPRRAMVSAEEVREALADPLAAIVAAIQDTLDASGPELAADLVDHGLLVCGGGAMLQGLEPYLSRQTGLPVRIAPSPAQAVVRGALVCLEHLESYRTVLEPIDDD